MSKLDLRVKRTYQFLSKALLELLNETPFEEIKVIDICERAMVHRTTFYKHFEDKYQLLSFVIEKVINDAESNLTESENTENPNKFYEILYKNVIDYIYDNYYNFKMLVKQNNYNSFTHMFHNALCAYIVKNLIHFENLGYHFIAPINIIAEYKVGGFLSVVFNLLNSDSQMSREELYKVIMVFANINFYMKKSEYIQKN